MLVGAVILAWRENESHGVGARVRTAARRPARPAGNFLPGGPLSLSMLLLLHMLLLRSVLRRLFAGEVVNPTENRAAEHTAQRGIGSETAVAPELNSPM